VPCHPVVTVLWGKTRARPFSMWTLLMECASSPVYRARACARRPACPRRLGQRAPWRCFHPEARRPCPVHRGDDLLSSAPHRLSAPTGAAGRPLYSPHTLVATRRKRGGPALRRRRFRDASPEEIDALTLDGMREAVMAQLHAGNLEVRWAPRARPRARAPHTPHSVKSSRFPEMSTVLDYSTGLAQCRQRPLRP
jgi:hypothetical protein